MTTPDMIKDAIKKSERLVPWFYTDRNKEGKVLMNIGYGEHHNDWGSYSTLIQRGMLQFEYADRNKFGPVSIIDIKADFDRVWAKKALWAAAEKITITRATVMSIERLFNTTFIAVEGAARAWFNDNSDIQKNLLLPKVVYVGYDTLPQSARAGLIDMFYNSGADIMKQFVTLKRAIKYGDWALAADNCRFIETAGMGGVRTRNDEREKIFRSLLEEQGPAKPAFPGSPNAADSTGNPASKFIPFGKMP